MVRISKLEYMNWFFMGFLVMFIIIGLFPKSSMHDSDMDMGEKREHYISLKGDIQMEMISSGKYKCCLVKPCTYCIEKTPGHGEGAECSCIEDLVNGVHPCGECIGEILEGHGNPYLKEYFAPAIAEKVGMEHLEELQEMIDEKYGK